MQFLITGKRTWLLFLAVVSIVYFHGLGHIPLVGADEPRYAQVAREMLTRGDWITPTLGGHTWFEKPALLYWMMIVAFKIFGVSEWSSRLGVALLGLTTIILIGWFGRRIERSTGSTMSGLGLASSVVLAPSAGLLVFSRGASFDVPITMTITSALACFFISEQEKEERKRRWLIVGFYAAVGASLLAKGLVGIVIPFGTVAVFALLCRRQPSVMKLGVIWWGLLITIAVAGVWYVPVISQHGWPFIDNFFIQHHFTRYISNKYRHPQPFYFYIPIMFVLLLPWSTFFIAALSNMRRWNWRGEDGINSFRLFAFAWMFVTILFFSLSGSKLPGYILPALPAMSLLAGEELAKFLRGDENNLRPMQVTGVLLIVLAVAAVIYSIGYTDVPVNYAFIILLLVGLSGLYVLVWAQNRKPSCLLVIMAAFGSLALTIFGASESMSHRHSVRDLMKIAAMRGYSSSPVYMMYTIDRTAEFYAAGQVVYGQDGEPVMFDHISDRIISVVHQADSPVLFTIPSEAKWRLTGYDAVETDVIGDNGVITLIAVSPR